MLTLLFQSLGLQIMPRAIFPRTETGEYAHVIQELPTEQWPTGHPIFCNNKIIPHKGSLQRAKLANWSFFIKYMKSMCSLLQVIYVRNIPLNIGVEKGFSTMLLEGEYCKFLTMKYLLILGC